MRTVRALLFAPAFLTTEYFSARRIRYLRPLTLCLAILALHLFAYSASDSVSMYDIATVNAASDKMIEGTKTRDQVPLSAQIRLKAAQSGTSVTSVQETINERWSSNASLVQIPLIFLFSLVLLLVQGRSGRYFVEHLVFAMHFISFQVLVQVMMWPLYFTFGVLGSVVTMVAAAIMYVIDLAYLFVAIRRFYGHTFGRALVRTALIFLGYVFSYFLMHLLAMTLAIRSVLAG